MARVICPHCLLPEQRCYCDLVTTISNPTEVIIWQHPTETNHPKGTAKLLKASLMNCQMISGEQISNAEFLSRVGSSQSELQLLFPGNSVPKNTGVPQNTENEIQQVSAENASIKSIRLLVLDGTWRKTRLILYKNHWLSALPRITLVPDQASDYRIRKAEQPGQLSTLEATCSALEQFEQTTERYQPLRRAFREYMDQLESNIHERR